MSSVFKMIGMDYKNTPLEIRENFSIPKEKAECFLESYRKQYFVDGCVILSTCNRTEIYFSLEEKNDFDAKKHLCDMLDLDEENYREYFFEKYEEEAISHLCFVAAGLESQIMGDDQIITQVRESLEFSRERGFSDSYMETIFKIAIHTAKTIKTKIIIRDVKNSSAPKRAIEKLKDVFPLKDKNVIVIGNGQMGRISSELFLKEGANVTITLREYKRGLIQISEGATTVSYKDRFREIEKADVVLSATVSPHFTINFEDFKRLDFRPKVLVDLAVPRDIDPKIESVFGTKIFTIDHLSTGENTLSKEKKILIREIILEQTEKYYKWRRYKTCSLY